MGEIEKRVDYELEALEQSDLALDPFKQFEVWYQRAVSDELIEPNAMVLATVGTDGAPTQRTVLLKYFDHAGFVFFTNYESRKATQIGQNSHVSLLFQWLPLQRQLEINGRAEKVSTAESLKYFATRPRGSQLGAWVSQQSTIITSRSLLEIKLAELRQKFSAGEIPLPSFWGGFRVVPERFEFWQGRPSRLHDRFEYLPQPDSSWKIQRLAP
jgi:pyridoxamine 5'-phosphate oxidase